LNQELGVARKIRVEGKRGVTRISDNGTIARGLLQTTIDQITSARSWNNTSHVIPAWMRGSWKLRSEGCCGT